MMGSFTAAEPAAMKLEGVDDKLAKMVSMVNLDYAPERRRVREAFKDVQLQIDHPLFKVLGLTLLFYYPNVCALFLSCSIYNFGFFAFIIQIMFVYFMSCFFCDDDKAIFSGYNMVTSFLDPNMSVGDTQTY